MADNENKMLEDSSSKLCGPCQIVRTRVFGPKKQANGPKPEDIFKLHDNYQQLSTCTSCPMCQFIRREFLYVREEDGNYRWPSSSSLPANAHITATVAWGIFLFQNYESYCDLKICVGEVEALNFRQLVKNIDESDRMKGQHEALRSEDCFAQMRAWIEVCLETHSSCTDGNSEFHPTRLLDLSGSDCGNDIRLIIPENDIRKQKGRMNYYATLSYCWGAPCLNATTTTGNLEERRHRIPFDSLPRTVQDAVILSRNLGIRYLWVGALCIIQGDDDDWARESSCMGQIYRHAFCTIAECIGSDCNSGLFAQREAGRLPTSRYLFAEGGASNRGFILEPEVDIWHSSVELSPLSTRGWVMQERILAARTIFCTEDGIFWQCAEKSSSEFKENASTGWPQSRFDKTSKPKFNELVKEWRTPATEFTFEMRGKLNTNHISLFGALLKQSHKGNVQARPWHNLVYEFTRRSLTKPDDRLRAVQGIANELSIATQDIYVGNAGIWIQDVIGGMAWYIDWNHESNRLSNTSSWSWASVTGRITSIYKRTGHVLNLAKINWKNTLINRYDRRYISITELHISGQICRIKIYKRGDDDRIFYAIDPSSEPPPPAAKPKKLFGFINRTLDLDSLSGVKSASGIEENTGWYPNGKNMRKDHHEVVFDVSEDDLPIGSEFICLAIVGAGFHVPTPQVFPIGLVLVPVDPVRKIYRRLGLCFMRAAIPNDRLREVEIILI